MNTHLEYLFTAAEHCCLQQASSVTAVLRVGLQASGITAVLRVCLQASGITAVLHSVSTGLG